MPEEVGPPNGDTTPKRLCASLSNALLQPAKRVRTSRYLLARARAAMWSRMMRAASRASLDQSASRAATRLAWLRRITPSSSTFNPLAASVDPGLRHRHHDIGAAEAETVDQQHALVGIRNAFAHQVLAGHAEMHRAAGQLRGDLARRKVGDLDVVEADDAATIVTRAARLRQRKSCAREEGFGVLLQAALRGDRQNERRAHDAPPRLPAAPDLRPTLVRVSTQTENPTAGIGVREPSWVINPSYRPPAASG